MCAVSARECAFATFVFRNDSYVPGALVLAHSLREQETPADLVVLVTAEVSGHSRVALSRLYDRVIEMEPITCLEQQDQHRQHLSGVLSRLNALRLGADGDLGCAYRRVVLIDADVLPIRCYDHLFLVDPPAGILNERAELFKCDDEEHGYVVPREADHGRWQWHHHYRDVPHGTLIPAHVTDRVLTDVSNYGINTAALVLEPDMTELELMLEAIAESRDVAEFLPRFRWPDMQFLTAWYSGRWQNVDACFAGLSGYPDVSLLFGTHFAGPKPWALNNRTVASRFSRFPDFKLWYREYLELLDRYPVLFEWGRLRRLAEFARSRIGSPADVHWSSEVRA